MLRRSLIAAVSVVLALTAAGCAGLPIGSSGDAAEAVSILQRAEDASNKLDSMSFFMTMNMDAGGQTFAATMHGGGYLKGDQAGDMAFQMNMSGAGVPSTDAQFVLRGGQMYFELGGSWQRLPGTLNLDQLQSQQLGALDIVKYVKDVHVEEHTSFLGEPVTKIAATIDGKQLLNSVLGQMNSSLGTSGGLQIPNTAFDVGDVRVVIYVSETTQLMRALHEDMTVTVQGQKAHIVLDMSVVGVNQPVDIPAPTV